jgi:hypothetical protein
VFESEWIQKNECLVGKVRKEKKGDSPGTHTLSLSLCLFHTHASRVTHKGRGQMDMGNERKKRRGGKPNNMEDTS